MQWLWTWILEKLRATWTEKDPSETSRRSLSTDGMMTLLVDEDWWVDTIL